MNEFAESAAHWLNAPANDDPSIYANELAIAAMVEASLAVAYEARTANLIARAALAERDMRDRLLDLVDERLKEAK